MAKKYFTFILILVVVATVLLMFPDPDDNPDSSLDETESADVLELERHLVDRDNVIRDLEKSLQNVNDYNIELHHYLEEALHYLYILDQEGIEVPEEFIWNYHKLFGGISHVAQEDYHLEMLDDSFTMKFFVHPNWIPVEEEQELMPNELVYVAYNTHYYLERAVNRANFGNDVLFHFSAVNLLNEESGTFITHLKIE
ncbi:MAG: hypothetical protein LRY73_00135 [Bacillus sp. (in: Bacteria)]|nr:hypothetical protein [Bacillus sp. (in: firmicutes)]